MGDDAIKKRRRWWLAGLLGFFMPGLGQAYNGQETKGLFFYFLVSIWGQLQFSLMYYCLKQTVTRLNIGLLILSVFITIVAFLLIIFESIRTAKKIGGDYSLKRYNKWYVYLAAILIGVGLNYLPDIPLEQSAKAYKIPAASMEPTIMIGDHLLCNRLYYQTRNPARGDIIIFEYPKNERMDFIKRIIGLPGDRIEMRNKEVFVNGNKLEEPYAVYNRGGVSMQGFGPIVVPDDEYFVLGDNRDNSLDSRFWGTVKRHKIRGKAIFIYFSWDMTKPWWNIFGRLFSIRFSRIGNIIQ